MFFNVGLCIGEMRLDLDFHDIVEVEISVSWFVKISFKGMEWGGGIVVVSISHINIIC